MAKTHAYPPGLFFDHVRPAGNDPTAAAVAHYAGPARYCAVQDLGAAACGAWARVATSHGALILTTI